MAQGILYRRSHSGKVTAPVIQKRSLDIELPEPEYVCPTTFLKRYRPHFGHMRNGSFVQIQQDLEHRFEATLVECTNGQFRPPCHGIDRIAYSSECVTVYEWRSAYVRLPNLNVDFVRAEIQRFAKWNIWGVIVIGDAVTGLQLEEGSSSLRIRRPRLSPEPSTISEPAVSLPSFAEGAAGEETEPSQIVGEETAEPSHAVASETIELRQGGVGNVVELDYQDKLLFFAYHTVLHGTSTAELGRMMMLIEVATGRAADIGVADITRFVDNLKSDLRLRKYVFCSSCFRTLVNKRALCPNSRCELYSEDVRYYRFYQGKLVPSKKYKTISQAGFGREDKARMTKSEWRRQALHMNEI